MAFHGKAGLRLIMASFCFDIEKAVSFFSHCTFTAHDAFRWMARRLFSQSKGGFQPGVGWTGWLCLEICVQNRTRLLHQ